MLWQAEAMQLLIAAGASVEGAPMKQKKHAKATHLPLESPLHSACRLPPNAAAPLVRTLLAANAGVHHLDQFGQTSLHVAAAACGQGLCARCAVSDDGATAVVAALLEAGANVQSKDHSGRTALDLVHQFAGGEPAAVTLLQDASALVGEVRAQVVS
jgi:ankyrin repeat protein